jgi:EAL domain-containing protein (putative c-di-GMP-specific phosphodiesterase class I)
VIGGRDQTSGHADGLLAETIDYATVVTGLLGHELFDHTERELLFDELSLVVAQRAYEPVFQPLVSLDGLDVVGYEALTRFSDGMSPEQRFADAESLGVGADLELATLAAAVADARALPRDAFLSLNVSPKLVVECATELRTALSTVDRPLVLELTEHDVVADYTELRSTLDSFDRPVRLSVDDAGAGFASLRHVLMLKPDFVKLDRSWISGIDRDDAKQALVAGLAHFATKTGCQLVAEGIETDGELSALASLDVPLGQGYLLGVPAPAIALP